uniref:Uncharacterized protein n=1 Tax=Nelumbo nucifera TaxID=4432 RepID=A0A822Z8B0_NELNU|nr:TPA_asm: hypothetical protein HUJ06_015410 [Nelumbo nucifera]
MGQALRRVSGRARSSIKDPPVASSSHVKNVERRSPVVSFEPTQDAKNRGEGGAGDPIDSDNIPRINRENVLEERDPGYDAMLSQMVGRIRSKPGGKLEMGEDLNAAICCGEV